MADDDDDDDQDGKCCRSMDEMTSLRRHSYRVQAIAVASYRTQDPSQERQTHCRFPVLVVAIVALIDCPTDPCCPSQLSRPSVRPQVRRR